MRTLPSLALVLTLAIATPISGQEVVTAEYDCRAMQTLSDFEDWLEADLSEKQEMWQAGDIFTVEEDIRATLGETQLLYPNQHGPPSCAGRLPRKPVRRVRGLVLGPVLRDQ